MDEHNHPLKYKHKGRTDNHSKRHQLKKARPIEIEDIPLDFLDGTPGNKDAVLNHSDLPQSISTSALLGDEAMDDQFYAEVAQKTQTHMLGRQEAELEVVIDRLIAKAGGRDTALLHVVTQSPVELKVVLLITALLHKGANPSPSDSELKTPLHHAVKRNFKSVCSRLLEYEALPHSRDKDGKMPYHLALENGNDAIASMLLDKMPNTTVRALYTSSGKGPSELCLHNLISADLNMERTALGVLDCMIDPVGDSGHVQVFYHVLEADEHGRSPHQEDFDSTSKSCLQLMSKRGLKTLVFHDVVRLLIRRKWKLYARFRFQMNCLMFFLTLMAMTYSAIVAVEAQDPAVYKGALHISRAVFEAWWYIHAVLTFCLEINQMRKHRLDYWKDQFNWLDFLSSSLLIAVAPLRFTHHMEQWHVFSVGYLLWTIRIFKYAAVFRQTGAYAQILWRIIGHDFLQFLTVFTVFLVAFSGSFVLALRGDNSLVTHKETSSFWEILFTGIRILIEGEPVVEYYGPNGFSTLGCILMVIFLFTCCVVLLNILIAQLSDTYQHVQRDAQRGLELNRAWIITRVELNSLYIGKVK
ncbi:transient receptor potential cation channel subfamily V member 3 isoform X3 [Patella vulgata]|uniref:transient receptor potential cation channel subfamily V member 3 isoform X3 n=1 Tax=Patella vulgata TaxID=6465 RepID=UPI0024A9AC44|nr:transient receptor potential cation channel subfamily V member 3 isoform X3 [Patella vulgata]